MRELYMSDDEIISNFQNARNKKAQVAILADLNAVDKRVIHNKLLALGLIDGEPIPEKNKGGRPKSTPEIDEAEARRLVEKDVPDEQIAKHFKVGISTFRAWRREKGIMRYPRKKNQRKTVEEIQNMESQNKGGFTVGDHTKAVDPWPTKEVNDEKPMQAATLEDVKQLAERVKGTEKNVQPVKVAADADGLTVEQMAALFTNMLKLGQGARVTVGGKPVRAATVNLRFDGSSDDPSDMSVELEV